jgi:hypothetical protein
LKGREVDAGAAALYALTAQAIEREVEQARAPHLTLDGSLDVDATVAVVEGHFAEALAAGPRAVTVEERRTLLREINVDVVRQIRAFGARPWASGDPEAVTRSFVCECGDTACTASVEATVGDAAARPQCAPGHD